MSPAPGSIDI